MGGGVIAALAFSFVVRADRLTNPWVVWGLIAVTTLSLVGVLAVGRVVNGAKRWIDLGPINIQPAEFAKLAVVVGISWYVVSQRERLRSTFYGIVAPLMGFAFLAGLVYATKDLGSVVVMFVALSAILWYGGVRISQFFAFVGLGIPILFYEAAWSVAYRRDRILSFLDPFGSEGPTAYHLQQSFIAIGSGGMHGQGLGEGMTKLGFLPERHTDFIYAVICEEFGFTGGAAVAVAYMLLVWVGLFIASQCRDLHRRLLVVGITAVIGFQAFGNLLVVTGCVPTKGMTLPFISYGGTSVAVCILLAAIIDSVAAAEAADAKARRRRTPPDLRGASITDERALRWQEA
jgi:cell division protein FtsW